MNRTLLITHFFPPGTGGAERYLDVLARHLPPADLIVAAPPMPNDRAIDAQVGYSTIRKDLLRHPFLRPAWLGHIFWLGRIIRQKKIRRLVFGHYAGFASLGLLAKIMFGIPYTVAVFGLDFMAYRKSLWRRIFLRFNLRYAEWVVTISTFTQQLLRDFGVPAGKIQLASPAMPPSTRPAPEAIKEFKRRHQLDNREILLTVARLVKRKGHRRVLDALPQVIAERPNLYYLIAGDGPLRQQLETLSRNLGIADHVRFLGAVSDHELNLAYAAADVFIMLPSQAAHDAEGFGIVYLEALAAGIPIIASASGGVTDIIRQGINGVALEEAAGDAEVANAILELFRMPQRRRLLGENGRADVRQRFTIDNQVNPFQRVLDQPPQSARQPPAVSIIIPVWNGSDTLARTLHSIRLQTFQDLEVIVVDDGSDDDPAQICQRFPGIRYLRQEHAGAPAARNRGFRASQGKYVLFCDADVTLHPRMVERLVTTIDLKPDAAYAYCSFRFSWRTFDLFDFDPARLKQSNYISMMSLIRREAFPGFDESIKRLQDWDLWLTMLEQGKTGVWVPARLFSATVGKRGISAGVAVPPATAVKIVKTKHHLA